jgi:hypothetical protein
MIKCNFISCPLNFNRKCFSGDGNLRKLSPFSKSPTECKASKGWVRLTYKRQK